MRYDQISPVPPLTKITKFFIIACVVTYFVNFILFHLGFNIGGQTVEQILGLVPANVQGKGWVWEFLTYIFLHGHPLHLLLNMLILWYFGSEIEMKIGEKEFFVFFLVCGIGAGLFNFGVNLLFNDVSRLTQPIIGASGAIYGILAAYGIFFGNRYFLVFFLFPMKAKYFVLVMAAIELITGVQANSSDNVAHFAHLGGMVIGAAYIYLRFIRPGQGRGSKRDVERERLKRQFTLIVNPDSKQESSEDKGPFWN